MKNEKKMVLELKWATAQTVLQYSLLYCKRGACLAGKIVLQWARNCIARRFCIAGSWLGREQCHDTNFVS